MMMGVRCICIYTAPERRWMNGRCGLIVAVSSLMCECCCSSLRIVVLFRDVREIDSSLFQCRSLRVVNGSYLTRTLYQSQYLLCTHLVLDVVNGISGSHCI